MKVENKIWSKYLAGTNASSRGAEKPVRPLKIKGTAIALKPEELMMKIIQNKIRWGSIVGKPIKPLQPLGNKLKQ